MEDQLFHVLKLSYDSLLDDTAKLYFIYCFIFPKEYVIRNDELIEHFYAGKNRLPHAVVDEMPLGRTVGLDSLYGRVCSCLAEDEVGILGLYGIRGVGKTTLMKKINNGLLETRHDFDAVIWVSVSEQASMSATQEVIGNKLQIIDRMWRNRSQDENAIEIFKIMKTKGFYIGVPHPDARNKSKVIITTRSMRICCKMAVQRIFEVEPLKCSEAWTLFIGLVREDTRPMIQQLAHSTLERCQVLAGCKIVRDWERLTQVLEDVIKKKFQVWRINWEDRLPHRVVDEMPLGHTVGLDSLYVRVCNCLTEYRGGIIGLYGTGGVGKTTLMKKINNRFLETWHQFDTVIWVAMSKQANVRAAQEFRVEFLAGEEALALFLEKVGENTLNSHPDIPHLSEKVAERCKGLPLALVTVGRAMADKNSPEAWDQAIQELEKYPAEISARRRGHRIIEDLKNACLLEGSRMWKKMNKILVHESLGHVEAERVTSWKEAERISLWGWNIEKLPQTPHCSNLQTLFVRECIQLKTFPRGFFRFMPLIRVLDLSATHCLTELPEGIERLVHLEYINLSMTHVKELRIGVTKLTKLRCLLLDGMLPLVIPPQVISSLSSLQLFSLYDGNGLSSYHATLLEQLDSIGAMDDLSLSFRSVVALNKLLSSYNLQRCIRRLSLHDCIDLSLLELSSIFLNYLEALVMFNCRQLEEMKINVEKEGSKGFEQSYGIPNPELIVRNNQHFRRLRDVKIWSCPKLLNLTWLIYAAHLQSLNVQFCESMKEVISNEYVTSSTQHASIFTRLTSLVLGGMPMLESIYRGALLFPSLEIISVINCPKLRRLPIDSISAAKSLKKIEGDLTWWGRLEWEDESVEENFTNYFSAQYLADPIQDPGEVKGKMKLVVEGSTSREPPKHSLSIAEVITHEGTALFDHFWACTTSSPFDSFCCPIVAPIHRSDLIALRCGM
ncbi:hypothetical protein AAG906_000006 [Vitis piasezkii]